MADQGFPGNGIGFQKGIYDKAGTEKQDHEDKQRNGEIHQLEGAQEFPPIFQVRTFPGEFPGQGGRQSHIGKMDDGHQNRIERDDAISLHPQELDPYGDEDVQGNDAPYL